MCIKMSHLDLLVHSFGQTSMRALWICSFLTSEIETRTFYRWRNLAMNRSLLRHPFTDSHQWSPVNKCQNHLTTALDSAKTLKMLKRIACQCHRENLKWIWFISRVKVQTHRSKIQWEWALLPRNLYKALIKSFVMNSLSFNWLVMVK